MDKIRIREINLQNIEGKQDVFITNKKIIVLESLQYQLLMRPKQRIRKIYTESDIQQRPNQIDQNLAKTNNINIKDLELNLGQGTKSISEQKSNQNYMYKNAHFYMPNKFNKMNRKQLIKKLPDINLASLSTISRPVKLSPLQGKEQDRMPGSNKKNTFLLNSIFEILKPQHVNDSKNELNRLKQRTLKLGQGKNISIDSFYQNQFINVSHASTKNRGPKVIENEITRLSGHNNIMRRKIVSQEKCRPKFVDKSLDKLKQTTFEHFKRVVRRDEENEFAINTLQSSQPKENFQNLQIITFYNKFPNFSNNISNNHPKKKEQQRPLPFSNKEIKYHREHKEERQNFKAKTEQRINYQEDNQFIFEKK